MATGGSGSTLPVRNRSFKGARNNGRCSLKSRRDMGRGSAPMFGKQRARQHQQQEGTVTAVDNAGRRIHPAAVFREYTESHYGGESGISDGPLVGRGKDEMYRAFPLLSRRGRLLRGEQFAGTGLAGKIPELPDGLFVAARAFVSEHSQRAGGRYDGRNDL